MATTAEDDSSVFVVIESRAHGMTKTFRFDKNITVMQGNPIPTSL